MIVDFFFNNYSTDYKKVIFSTSNKIKTINSKYIANYCLYFNTLINLLFNKSYQVKVSIEFNEVDDFLISHERIN